MGVGGQRHAPAALPPGMTRYPFHRRLGGPQGRSGRGLKILPPSGFDPRTVQLVASRYTYYAIPAHPKTLYLPKFKMTPPPPFTILNFLENTNILVEHV
jgi:hypothetical protein